MIRSAAAAILLLAGASQDSAPPSSPPPPELELAQVTIRQQVIIRVPRGGQRRVEATASPVKWREGAGPRCIHVRQIAGAMPASASVDFLLRDNKRVRARLGQRCAGLDYYSGMYLAAHPDGQICADRDVVRSRMGGQCGISEFRSLQPVRP
jgi:hypothetical protein